MAYGNNNNGGRSNSSVDQFGNTFSVVGCKPSKNPAFCHGYVEIKGDLYKIEPSTATKEGVSAWVRITKMKPKGQTNNRRGL